MMARILFLTSSPDSSWQEEGGAWVTGPLAQRNGFLARVQAVWPENGARVLAVAADPDDGLGNDEMGQYYMRMLEASRLPVERLHMLDRRTQGHLDEWLPESDFVVLSGGHVPTENAFFKELGLRERIQGYNGIIMGISAGTMNCADLVYAQPELEGESIDPGYRRFFTGLGLTRLNILPHYQKVKDSILDGKRLMEDITYGDSRGHCFYALEDGSYVVCEGKSETLYGNAYEIKDGRIRMICEEGGSRVLKSVLDGGDLGAARGEGE